MRKIFKLLMMLIATMFFLCDEASAHRWFMHSIRFQGGTDFNQCLADTYKAAQNVMSIIGSKGYRVGTIKQGQKSIRVDGIGYRDTSIYLFCSPWSLYILTGHMPGDDDTFWDLLYETLIAQFPRG
jgi:hypothetical protein